MCSQLYYSQLSENPSITFYIVLYNRRNLNGIITCSIYLCNSSDSHHWYRQTAQTVETVQTVHFTANEFPVSTACATLHNSAGFRAAPGQTEQIIFCHSYFIHRCLGLGHFLNFRIGGDLDNAILCVSVFCVSVSIHINIRNRQNSLLVAGDEFLSP